MKRRISPRSSEPSPSLVKSQRTTTTAMGPRCMSGTKMRTLEQLRRRIAGYGEAEYIYERNVGYIVWHYSTGDNVEILFIETRANQGAMLVKMMVEALIAKKGKPYHSVFVFSLGENERARKFYTKLGMKQVNLGSSIYRDGETVLSWISWDELLQNLDLKGKP